MGQFLRDQFITNVTLDESRLNAISQLLVERALGSNQGQADQQKLLAVTYVIRFDQKGHRFATIQDVMRFYLEARRVERVIFTMESPESRASGRNNGAHLELRLDATTPTGCTLVTSADDGAWVDAAFGAVSELLQTFRNKHGLVRNAWTAFFVQIFGVVLGFIFCLWAASIVAPKLSIENPFAISFLFALLIFSNIWGYLNQIALNVLNYTFPNVLFKRTGRESLHWLWQAIIGGMVLAIVLFVLEKLLSYAGTVLGGFIKT